MKSKDELQVKMSNFFNERSGFFKKRNRQPNIAERLAAANRFQKDLNAQIGMRTAKEMTADEARAQIEAAKKVLAGIEDRFEINIYGLVKQAARRYDGLGPRNVRLMARNAWEVTFPEWPGARVKLSVSIDHLKGSTLDIEETWTRAALAALNENAVNEQRFREEYLGDFTS